MIGAKGRRMIGDAEPQPWDGSGSRRRRQATGLTPALGLAKPWPWSGLAPLGCRNRRPLRDIAQNGVDGVTLRRKEYQQRPGIAGRFTIPADALGEPRYVGRFDALVRDDLDFLPRQTGNRLLLVRLLAITAEQLAERPSETREHLVDGEFTAPLEPGIARKGQGARRDGIAGRTQDAVGYGLDEQIAPAWMIIGLSRGGVDLKQDFGVHLRDRQIAVPTKAIKNATQQVDVDGADPQRRRPWRRQRRRAPSLAGTQRPAVVDNGVSHLQQGKPREALRHPTRLIEHVEQQFELGLAADLAILGDMPDQPLRVLLGQIALGHGLIDDEVGDGLDETIGPGRVLDGAGIVEG